AWHCIFACFFIQAEDGIRDRNVTGVQTCALPISIDEVLQRIVLSFREHHIDMAFNQLDVTLKNRQGDERQLLQTTRNPLTTNQEIGRASCREREWTRLRAESWTPQRA